MPGFACYSNLTYKFRNSNPACQGVRVLGIREDICLLCLKLYPKAPMQFLCWIALALSKGLQYTRQRELVRGSGYSPP